MSHQRPVTVLCRLWIGYTAISIASAVSVVSASYAQDPQVLVHRTAAAGSEAEEPSTHEEAEELLTHEDVSEETRTKTWEHMGAFVAEPIGKFWVGPEFVGGEPVYLLRTPVVTRIASVEVSTTPFMSELTGVYELSGRPDENPADW